MKNIAETLVYSHNRFPERAALTFKNVDNKKQILTYDDLSKMVAQFAINLLEIKIKRDNRVVILSENRYEWIVADLGILSIGAISVPIYPVLSGKQMMDILEEISPSLVVISDSRLYAKIEEYLKKAHTKVLFFDDTFKDITVRDKYFTFREFIASYKSLNSDELEKIIEKSEVDDEELATIIYTSGTSGKFRGIMLTHKNILSNIPAIRECVLNNEKDVLLSMLPLSHAFERVAGHYTPLSYGSSISYVSDIKHIQTDLSEFKPTIILGVPRIYEKIYLKITENFKRMPFGNFILSKLSSTSNSSMDRFWGYLFKKLFEKKIKKVFGGKIRILVCGSAAISENISLFFNQLGILFLEGYGLTEASPIVSGCGITGNKIGTVGRVFNNVEYLITDEDELLIRGDSIAKNYWTEDGPKELFQNNWLHTGDLVKIDREGFLKIIGRKKEIIVLSTGKKVVPAKVEELLEASNYVIQAFVYGDDRKYISALIYPDKKFIKEFFSSNNKLTHDKLMALLDKEIHSLLGDLADYEKIKKFACIKEPFTVENGMLTPTLKLRRNIIAKEYRKILDSLY